MPDPQTRYDQLIARLKSQDYRLTPQRVERVRLIATGKGHPSAAELYNSIRVKFPTMSLATVYKTLDLLKGLGEVIEIGLHDDSHYDGSRPFPHPHLICIRCKKILDGDLNAPVRSLITEMEQLSGFWIVRHQLDFYGLCPDCQKSRKQTGCSGFSRSMTILYIPKKTIFRGDSHE